MICVLDQLSTMTPQGGNFSPLFSLTVAPTTISITGILDTASTESDTSTAVTMTTTYLTPTTAQLSTEVTMATATNACISTAIFASIVVVLLLVILVQCVIIIIIIVYYRAAKRGKRHQHQEPSK